MNENNEFSVFNMEFKGGERLAQEGYDYLAVEFSKEEAEECEALLQMGNEDNEKLLGFIQEAKSLMTKEGLLECLKDDRKRRILFETLSLVSFFSIQVIGSLDPSTSEISRSLVSVAPYLDESLKYLYELDCAAGPVELYSDSDNEELRKDRVKFFLSNDVYKLIETTKPVIIDNIIHVLGIINKHAGYKEGHNAA